MSLTKFEVFSRVVELGSLKQAAESLSLTQSAVSHAIASLESEWGFTILIRGRSGDQLTSNGERVLRQIHEMLKWNEQMLQEIANIKGLEIGTVRIGTFSSVSIQWLPEILKNFNANLPAIDVKLLEGDYDTVEHWIATGSVDFGFVSLPTSKSFEVKHLKKDRILCILPDGHRLANQQKVSFSDIQEEMLIMTKKGSDNDLKRVFRENQVTPRIKFELADDQAIISMVQNGLGISLLPEMVLHRVPQNVCILSLEGEHYRSIGLAAPSFNTVSPAARKFIDYVKAWLNNAEC